VTLWRAKVEPSPHDSSICIPPLSPVVRSRNYSYFTTGVQSVCLGVGHPFGAHDQILLSPFFCRKIASLFVFRYPLWREDGSVNCTAICQWSESRRTHNHTLLSHLRLLGSLSVTSHESQGLRWKYSTLSDERTGLSFVLQSVSGQSRGGLVTIRYCLTWDHWVPFPSTLTIRRDYGASIFTPLHAGICYLLVASSYWSWSRKFTHQSQTSFSRSLEKK
jgi:hypothetical protein